MTWARTVSDERLIDVSTRRPAVFRQPFSEHVRDFDGITRREAWTRYWAKPSFKAAYDARLSSQRAEILPC